jgi:1,4-alpha-glucan branching enzyme
VTDERDETIERIASGLRPLPEIDPAARARVLVAVAAEREQDREQQRRPARRRALLIGAIGIGLAAAMAFVAVLVTREHGAPPPVAVAPITLPRATSLGNAPATLAARETGGGTLQQVQLVFRDPRATRVSVVGDFTGWDARKAVMTRDSGSGLWTATLSLPAGRHVYAFLVDDSVWVRDPRAPAAPDADFGRPGSVLLVGRP